MLYTKQTIMNTIKAGIIGATGYTGSELVRILLSHPHVSIEIITSESKAGFCFSDIHPQFKYIADIQLQPLANAYDIPLDVVFLALPHGVSMNFVEANIDKPYKIIDLSADFRLSSKEVYKEWYGTEHIYPEGLEKDVYGLPELNKQAIKQTQFISNPGCYVTSAILGLAPLVQHKLIDPSHIIVDSKSGVTGAGAKVKENTHFPNINDDFKPYSLTKHRHTIEIQEVLESITDVPLKVLFTPHLLPVDRGILSVCYGIPVQKINEKQLMKLYHDFYQNEPFVRVIDNVPSIKAVRGSNYCDIKVCYDKRTDTIMAITALDNLVKGASGQAVQNMNLMFGLEETTGLTGAPIKP
jgi:N-acetyl-gamma-glutamyl-phosphate reductase